MDLVIDTLNIALAVKIFLKSLGFEKTSELSTHNYFTLTKLSTDYHKILYATYELNKINLIKAPCANTHIDNIKLSSRLKNILKRNYVFYLCQLSEIPKEVILQFRGLGELTIRELEQLCKAYDIELHSFDEIKNNYAPVRLPLEIYTAFFQYHIYSPDDLRKIPTSELYQIFNKKSLSLDFKIIQKEINRHFFEKCPTP